MTEGVQRFSALDPRGRIRCFGEESLSDEDLIALILGSGTRQCGVGRIAGQLIEQAGGLRSLTGMRGAEIMHARGIGPARAARLLAAFSLARRLSVRPLFPGRKVECSRDIFDYYHPLLRDKKKEFFFVLLLDSKNRLVAEEKVSEGSLTASIVHPREVYLSAVRSSAAGVLVLHNHPSGDPSPSREDYEITIRLKEVGDLLGIALLDHVILGEDRYVSFREHRLISWDTL